MSAPAAHTVGPLALLREEADAQAFAHFGPTALCRLALVPEWTDDLAREVGLWTHGTGPKVLDELEEADLIERRPVLAPGGRRQEAFWIRARARIPLAGYLQKTWRSGIERDLDELVKAIGRLDVDELGLRAWIDVVAKHRADTSGLSLVAAVDELVATGRLAEATDLVGAARAVGEVTGGPLVDASRRASWRIDRAYRAAVDKGALRFYLHRAGIEEALDEVIGSASGSWALHLLGDGGVGKTMLVRYLASGRYAEERGRAAVPVARADFDHIDPRYPEERPGELLLALAHELVGFGTTRDAYKFLRQFQDAANVLHEECARPEPDPGTVHNLLGEAVRRFAMIVAEAGGPARSPVVLVLDTCEELAKLYPPGASAPAIDRTFDMLETLKETLDKQARAVCVVLAGRRWLTPADDASDRAAGPLLLPRPYVRVLRVKGLSAREASDYIDLRVRVRRAEQPAAPALDPALREAVLDRARERDGATDRYNPFELASYCEWACSDEPPDARELREAPGDPYVRLRIIGRITDNAVRQALPVAVEFGRFDAELIGPALTRQGLDPEAVFAGLASQEWVRAVTVTSDGRPGVVEVDEHLRDRIRAVLLETKAYTTADPARLGRDAAEVIQRGPLRAVPAEAVEAAVRLLPATDAAVLWERIEAQILTESAWPWAETVTARAAAVELERAERSGPDSPTILGAILATQAAGRTHSGASDALAALWQQVADTAGRFPDPRGAMRLEARAVLGRVAAGDDVDDNALDLVGPFADAGSLVAAVDGPIGRGQRPPGALARMAADAVAAADDHATAAALRLAEATLALWDGRLDTAAHAADLAVAAAQRIDATDGSTARDWPDWRRPPRLVDRCRLARLLIACQRGEPLTAVPFESWRGSVVEHPSDIDAQRLAALTIRFELGHRPVAANVVNHLNGQAEAAPARACTWLHRQVRPLAVELAEAWSVLGEPTRAADLLRGRRDSSVGLGDDPETIEASQLAQLYLCRRYRTTQYASSLLQLAREGTAAVRAEAWLVLTLLGGERPESPFDAGSWHGWWRSQDVWSLRDTLSPPPPPESEPGTSALASAADALEYQAVMGLPAESTPGPGRLLPALAAGDEHGARLWLLTGKVKDRRQPEGGDGRPREDERAELVRLQLAELQMELEERQMELEELQMELDMGRPPLADGTFGRAALGAGEVLALRLPQAAAGLLREAGSQLAAAGDDLGAGQAHVLAGLASARAGRGGREASPPESASRGIAKMAEAPEWTGWSSRLAAWRALADGSGPASGDPSPELDFRISPDDTAAPTTQRWRLSPSLRAYLRPTGYLLFAAWLALEVSGLVPRGLLHFINLSVPITVFVAVFASYVNSYWREGYVAGRAIAVRPADDGKAALAGRRHGAIREFEKGPASTAPVLARLRLSGFRQLRWSADVALDPPGPLDLQGLRLPEKPFFGLALVVLEVDPRLEAYPWEQWLGQAASRRARRRLVFVRTVVGNTPSLPPKVWSSAPAVYRGPRVLAPPNRVARRAAGGQQRQSHPRRRAMHLIGTPVRTAGGWRLRVGETVSAAITESSRSTVAGEELVSMDGLDLSATRLVVLQAEPIDGPPRALGDLGPGFRALAREAADAGAGAVIVVPPLPDTSAAEVVQTTWSRFASRRRPPPMLALFALAAKAKTLAAEDEPPSSGDRAILDVLMFLRVPERRKDS